MSKTSEAQDILKALELWTTGSVCNQGFLHTVGPRGNMKKRGWAPLFLGVIVLRCVLVWLDGLALCVGCCLDVNLQGRLLLKILSDSSILLPCQT